MKNFLTSFLLLAGIYTAYAVVAPISSPQIGTSPSNGYVLQTNGATSTWVSTSSLGITGSGINLLPLNNTWTGTNTFATTTVSNLIANIGANPSRPIINTANLTLPVGPTRTYTTIQAAVDKIPQNIAYPVRINVDCGTYPEDVVVQPSIGTRLVNGSVISVPLQITGSTTNPGCVIVNSFTFNGTAIGSYTGLNGFTIATSSPYSITGDGELAGISAFGVTDLGLNYIRFLSGVDGLLCYESHCMLGEDVDFGNNVLTGNAIKSKRGNARVDFDPANTWNASGTVGQYAYDAQSSGVINFNSNKSSLTGNIGLINVDDNKMGQVFDGGDRAMYMLQKIYPVASTTVGSVLEISNINDPNGLTSLKLTEGLGTPSSWSFNSRNTNPDSGLTLSGGIYGDERFMMSVDLGRNFGFATTSGSGWRLPAHLTVQDVTDDRNTLSFATYFNDGSPIFSLKNTGQIQSGTTTGDSMLSIVATSSVDIFNFSSSTGDTLLKLLSNGNLGIITPSPTHSLTLDASSTGVAIYNTKDQTTNYERGLLSWASNTFRIETQKGGTGGSRSIALVTPAFTTMLVRDTGTTAFFDFSRGDSVANNILSKFSGTQTNSSGSFTGMLIAPTLNQSASAGYSAFQIQPTETAVGTGTKLLLQVGTSTFPNRVVINNLGNIGIGTSSPTHPLTFASTTNTTNGIALYNTLDQTTNYERVVQDWSGNAFRILSGQAGSGALRDLQLGSAGRSQLILSNSSPYARVSLGSSAASTAFNINFSPTNTTGTSIMQLISGSPNQPATSSANYIGLRIQPTEVGVSTSTPSLLIQAGTSTNANLFVVDNIGRTGVGTGTPLTNLQVTTPATNATTTVTIGKAGQNKGSCLELYDTSGAVQYVSITGGALVVSATSCK